MKRKFIAYFVSVIIVFFSVNILLSDKMPEKNKLKGNIPLSLLAEKKINTFKIVEPLSKITFYGKSTLHSFDGFTDNVNGYIKGSPENIEKAECSISFNSKTLHTKHSKLNKNMWENLNADKYKEIKFDMKKVKIKSLDIENKRGEVIVAGILFVNGISREIYFPLNIEYTEGFVHFTGKYSLNMFDYKIKPRSFMWLIKVDKNVDIDMDIYAELSADKIE